MTVLGVNRFEVIHVLREATYFPVFRCIAHAPQAALKILGICTLFDGDVACPLVLDPPRPVNRECFRFMQVHEQIA